MFYGGHMKITRPGIVRGIVAAFALVSGVISIILGPIQGYHQLDFVHSWAHIVYAIIALIASLSLFTARVFLQITAVIAILLVAYHQTGGHFLHVHFGLTDDIGHFVLFLISFYFGFIFKTNK